VWCKRVLPVKPGGGGWLVYLFCNPRMKNSWHWSGIEAPTLDLGSQSGVFDLSAIATLFEAA